MKECFVSSSKNDNFYTPEYAVIPILKYVKLNSTIWCPFDTQESNYVKLLREQGHKVIHTHIDNGENFFETEVPECDYIISNPPYSLKTEILERLFKIGKPFAMLINGNELFGGQKRFDLFKNNKFEIMYFNKRISYFQDYNNLVTSKLNPPFSSVYICHNFLPEQIMFETVNKK